MRDDPGFDKRAIGHCLTRNYGLSVESLTFLPIGYDLTAAAYDVRSRDAQPWFLKVRTGPVNTASLEIPRSLFALGIRNVLAPIGTKSGDLWSSCNGYSLVLYPFIEGRSAVEAGLSDVQWREFGTTLRAVHDSGLGEVFRGRIPVETFALPSALLLRSVLQLVCDAELIDGTTTRFASFLRACSAQIEAMITRAEGLGGRLQDKLFPLVLCHSDIHAANILVGDDGRIYLADWDGPIFAPKERDLLFVIGSRIARAVEPREEELFFEGYGPVKVNSDALIYYRYERVIEDLGEFGKEILITAESSEHARSEATDLVMSFFEPGGIIETIETVTAQWSPIT